MCILAFWPKPDLEGSEKGPFWPFFSYGFLGSPKMTPFKISSKSSKRPPKKRLQKLVKKWPKKGPKWGPFGGSQNPDPDTKLSLFGFSRKTHFRGKSFEDRFMGKKCENR